MTSNSCAPLLHMCMFLLYDAVVLLKQTGWGLCRSGSRGLGMGKHGFGAVSPRHNARNFSDTQRPLRQLLSGNSGQARGGGFPKPYGLGGGAHMNACTAAPCQQACRCLILPCGYAQPRPALWPACEATRLYFARNRWEPQHCFAREVKCVTHVQCQLKSGVVRSAASRHL